MTYDRLLEIGRSLTPTERKLALAQLCNDERFAALVAILEDELRESAVVTVSEPEVSAKSATAIHHCAGSIYGIRMVQGRIRQAANHPTKKKGAEPQQDE